jgi:hypothetical protein
MRSYRRNNPINKTTGILFILLILALGATGYSYSTWTKTLTIQGKINTGYYDFTIVSGKLLIPNQEFNETHPIHFYIGPDNLTLVADCKNVTGEWTIKIGLLVKNNGTLPIDLTETAITYISTTNLQNSTHYYNFNPAKWDGIPFNDVPPSGDTTPPIQLDRNEQAITWTTIQIINSSAAGENIQIIVTPEFQPFP